MTLHLFITKSRNIGNIDAQIQRDSFAGPLKETVRGLFDINPYTSRENKETPVQTPAGMLSPRQVWQKFGVGMREIFGEDFWVEKLYHRWIDEPIPMILIVDDVRFPNETRIIRERGGLVVGLKCPGYFEAARSGHSSESEMYEHWGQMVDLEVVNDGDLGDLREIACEVAADVSIVPVFTLIFISLPQSFQFAVNTFFLNPSDMSLIVFVYLVEHPPTEHRHQAAAQQHFRARQTHPRYEFGVIPNKHTRTDGCDQPCQTEANTKQKQNRLHHPPSP